MPKITVLLLFIWPLNAIWAQPLEFIDVPKQKINLNRIAGLEGGTVQKYSKFRMSQQINLRQYKAYLSDVKRDSNEIFYQTQLPNFSKRPELTAQYLNAVHLDDYPVVGVSMDNALLFANWYQRKWASKGNSFRLPTISEFMLLHARDTNVLIGQEALFSNWTLNSYDESAGIFANNKSGFPYEYIYHHKSGDPKVKKRKMIIGNSFFMQKKDPMFFSNFGYYADLGYTFVSFRIVEYAQNKEH